MRQTGRPRRGFLLPREMLSPAVAVLGLIALVSTLGVATLRPEPTDGLSMWMFARAHKLMYDPVIERWNEEHTPVRARILSIPALERRMLGGFLAELPTADLLEVERRIARRAFAGPPDTIGFLDLTDRLRAEGLLERINPPSFSPWSSRGRIYGLPHDVHPVMLAYRRDLVEAAGIDLSRVETWDEFIAAMRPLMGDNDGDGQPDRYLLPFWTGNAHLDVLELLLLQNGGGFFDAQGRVDIDNDANAQVLIELVRWMTGETRVAADVPEFNPSGNALKLEGYIVAMFMPDWLCNIYRNEMPALEGKIALMPMPAWNPGGRRTSVWGGTMLGISRLSADPETAWAFAKHLYLSDELSRVLYEEGDIITPVVDHWSDPIFDEPDPFFSGQPKGRMYIDLAPDVPERIASPYSALALTAVQTALVRLKDHADALGTTDRAALAPRARELLAEAERQVRAQVARNVFLAEGEGP